MREREPNNLWDRFNEPEEQDDDFSDWFILHDIRTSCEGDEDLEELYEDLEKLIDRYLSRILDQTIVYHGDHQGREFITHAESTDIARSRTHSALFDQLTIIAREAKKRGRATNWWDDVGGFQGKRDRAGDWAHAVAYTRLRAKEEARREGLHHADTAR